MVNAANLKMKPLSVEIAPRYCAYRSQYTYVTLSLPDMQTGLRCSELFGWRWRDTELDSGVLSVQRAWVKLPSGGKDLSEPTSEHGRVAALSVQSID